MLDRPSTALRDASFPPELLIWLSPAFPIGAFAYSQGLETAASRGLVRDAATLTDWLSSIAAHGALRNDLIILSLVHRAPNDDKICTLSELAAALQPSRERAEETLQQGQAFMDAYHAAWADGETLPLERPPLHVAVGAASRAHGLDLAPTLLAYATAFAANMVSAAIRLGVIGQFDGQRVLAALMPRLRESAHCAMVAGEDDLGSATFAADLASIRHETQAVRLFRS
ncbi:MAG: urease accessory protein UreF [Rhodomicrobiaceae bacterium]